MGLNRRLQGPFAGHQRSPWLCQGLPTQPHRPARTWPLQPGPRRRLPRGGRLMPSPPVVCPLKVPPKPLVKSPSQFRARIHRGEGDVYLYTCSPRWDTPGCAWPASPRGPSHPCLCAGMSRQPPGSLGTTLGIGPSKQTALTGCPGLAPSSQARGDW